MCAVRPFAGLSFGCLVDVLLGALEALERLTGLGLYEMLGGVRNFSGCVGGLAGVCLRGVRNEFHDRPGGNDYLSIW